MPQKNQGHRLRSGRFSASNHVYSITMVCYGRQQRFTTWRKGRCFVEALKLIQGEARTFCFVVMPDHVHWLVQLSPGMELSPIVQKVKSLTTKNLHQLDKGSGRVWQRGFYDHLLGTEEDVRVTARYIIANPLRARLVESVGDYALWDACWL